MDTEAKEDNPPSQQADEPAVAMQPSATPSGQGAGGPDIPMRFFGQGSVGRAASLRELWAYRDLFLSLALRDLQVQYRQTVIGVLWALIRPVMLMIVFTVLFQLMGKFPAKDPGTYAVTLYTALLPWLMFTNTLTKSTSSLVLNQQILTKVYFPRLILPMVPLAVGLIDFVIAFVVLIGMMVWYSITPSINLLCVPLFVLLAMTASFAIGMWLSAANALYRDIGYAVPFAIQIGMFLSPVVYEMNAVIPQRWQLLYSLNPMVGVLEGFRWALLGGERAFPFVPVLFSVGMVMIVLIFGVLYFRRVERFVADRV